MVEDLNNKIIVIGNGPSVLNNKYGDIIDQFGEIVRFNNFVTEGYEEYIGRRTTILAMRSCDDVRLYNAETLRRVLCFITYCRWSSGMLLVAQRQIKPFYGSRCEVIGLKETKSIGEAVGLDQPYNEWASIGILTLGYLTRRFSHDRIIIHGFDGLIPNESGTVSHYFSKPPKDNKYHNSTKELAYIKSLNLQTLENFVWQS